MLFLISPVAPVPQPLWPAVWELCSLLQLNLSLVQGLIAPHTAAHTVPERRIRKKMKVVIFFSSGFFSTLMWFVGTHLVIWERSFSPSQVPAVLSWCPGVPVTLWHLLQLKAISWVCMSKTNSQWGPQFLCAVTVQQNSIYWSLTVTVVGQQLLLMGALPGLSAAACIYVALWAGGGEGTWVRETRKGSAPGQHFWKQRNLKALKCIKIKPHFLIHSIHLARENWSLRLNVYIKKLEMIGIIPKLSQYFVQHLMFQIQTHSHRGN